MVGKEYYGELNIISFWNETTLTIGNYVSIAQNVITTRNHNIMKLLYEKFEYLGFEPKKIEAKTDMSFKETLVFFCDNFMDYFDNNEDSSFIDKIKRP